MLPEFNISEVLGIAYQWFAQYSDFLTVLMALYIAGLVIRVVWAFVRGRDPYADWDTDTREHPDTIAGPW